MKQNLERRTRDHCNKTAERIGEIRFGAFGAFGAYGDVFGEWSQLTRKEI